MAFDTRAYAKRWKKAGIKRKQARAHAEALNRYLRPDLATKADIAALEQATNANLVAMEQRIDRRMSALERSISTGPSSTIRPVSMSGVGSQA